MTTTHSNNGRLCNQIFRNLAVSFVSKKHDLQVNYSSYDKITELGIQLYSGKNIYSSERQMNDDNFFDILNETHIDYNLDAMSDFFQTKEISNFLYNYLHEDGVKNSIIEKNPFNQRYNNNNDCIIHVRLTDASRYVPSIEYYLNTLLEITFDNLYITTDEKEHSYIKIILENYPNATVINFDEVKTIQYASTCKHIILSHGSYSAIIGYLGFFSDVYYKKYDQDKIWYGDMFSIPNWNMKLL
jgi:hypothetical protein